MDSGCLHHLFCSKYTLSGATALCWQSSGQNGGYDQWDPRGFQHRHQNESGARVQLSEAYWRLITEGALNTHGSKNTLEVEWYDWLVLLLLYTLLHQNLCKTCCRFWRFDILMNMDGIHRFLHDEKRWVLSQGAIHKSLISFDHTTGFATSEFQNSRRYNGVRICPCIRTPRKQATVMLVALDCWWLTLLDSVGSCFFSLQDLEIAFCSRPSSPALKTSRATSTQLSVSSTRRLQAGNQSCVLPIFSA